MVSERKSDRKFITFLFLVFAVSALALALLSIYAMVAYSVRQGRREVAIRAALGARPSKLVQEVTREGLLPIVGGLMAGALAGLAMRNLLAGFLFLVQPADPLTFITVTALLALGA